MRNPLLGCLCIASLLLSSAVSHSAPAGYYRWTDENGHPQFTQLPPDGKEAEWVESYTGRSAPPPAEEPAEAEQPKPEGILEGSTVEGLPEKDPVQCKNAKQTLETLAFPRIRMRSADGSIRVLTEEERQEQRSRAEEVIKLHCN